MAVAGYGFLKTDTIRAQIVYCGFKQEELGGDISIRENSVNVKQATPKIRVMLTVQDPPYVDTFTR
jgi:hypothetical protein